MKLTSNVKVALFGVVVGLLIAAALALGWVLGSRSGSETHADEAVLLKIKLEEARRDAAVAEAERLRCERRDADERKRIEDLERLASESLRKRREAARLAEEERMREESRRKKESLRREEERACEEARDESQSQFLSLKITRVLAPGVGIDDPVNGIGDAVKKSLTNEMSIVVWRPEGDKVVHEFCYFVHSTKSVTKTGGRRRTEDVYTLKASDALKSAPWCVLTYTKEDGQREVLWKWNRNSETCRLPEDGKGGVDLGDVVFGKAKTARELWKRSYPGAVFVARLTSAFTDKNGRPMYALVLKMEDPSLTVSAFAGLKETLRKKKTDLESKINELENPSGGFGKKGDEDPQEQLEAIRAAANLVSSLHGQWKEYKKKAKNDDRAKEDAASINEQIREIAEKWAVKKGDKYKGPNEVPTYLDTMCRKAKNLECKVAERDQELRKLKRDLEKLEDGIKGMDGKNKAVEFEVSVGEQCPAGWKLGMNDLAVANVNM